MSMKIVLDSNIFISFNDVSLLQMLTKFMENKDNLFEFIVSDGVFEKECSRGLRNQFRDYVTIKEVKKEFVREVKDNFIRAYKKIHTNRDIDYEIVALSIKEKTNYLVTNDRDIICGTSILFEKHEVYRNEKGNEMKLTSLAGLIRMMYKYKKNIFNGKRDLAAKYFLFYREIELPNCHEGIKEREWPVSTVQRIIDPYKENVLTLIE